MIFFAIKRSIAAIVGGRNSGALRAAA